MKPDTPTIARLVLAAAVVVASVAARAYHTEPPQTADAAIAERIHRIETGFAPIPLNANEPPLQFNLQKLMELYKVPGVSIAVIENYKIAWAKAYGVTEAGGTTPVTTHTLFQAGSISKPVAATGALYLVEHNKLSLDEDVNKKLVSWKVPDNDFTKDQKVTLRRLMTHSGGLTVHGFPGYPADAPVPTVVQVLNGEKPANTAPVRVFFVPGTKSEYSGGGVTIEQLLVQDVTGKPFPVFMRETVLDKIGMTDSTYEQPLPVARAALAASGTYADSKVVQGRFHVYPEMAAAGLWTTPTDLAKFAIEIGLSKHGKSNRVLSESMTQQMLTPQIDLVGLGFFLGDAKSSGEFLHNGADEGFQAVLLMFADSGQGVVVMADSDNGINLAEFFMENIAKEYGWPSNPFKPSTDGILSLILSARGGKAALEKYSAWKQSGSTEYRVDENTLIGLGYQLLQRDHLEEAILVFQREVQDYPKYWNSYDSLGEAYMKVGQREAAVQNYEKSIELNPTNQNGIDMLKKLKGQR
jgi:CubicO group peptidase (beta-lactamase class C family)